MPLSVLTPVEEIAAKKDVESDLKWLLSDNGVDDDVQTVLYHFGFKKMKLFAGAAGDQSDLRDMIKDQIGLDPATSLFERIKGAAILVAWKAAQIYVEREDTKRAEARASKIPKEINAVEHIAMRKAYEATHGTLQKNEVPSKAYLGLKLEDIEDDEPKAEKLTEVMSKDDGEEQYLSADVDLADGGIIKIKKGSQNGHLP